MKKLALVLICICIFMLAGCQSEGELPNDKTPDNSANVSENDPGSDTQNNRPVNSNSNSTGTDTSGFQKEMNVQHPFRISAACKTEAGYYFDNEGFLYFLDGATGNVTVVCARPECSHNDDNCNAWVNTHMLSYYQGKLYYVNSDEKSDSMYTLYSVNLDGTDHAKIQRLQLEFVPWRTVIGYPILANGSLYFLEGDSQIYTVKLGEDVSKAVLVFEDDISNTLESSWQFWADGSEVYAMNTMLNSEGYCQDILYLLGASQSETREVWRSTELGISDADYSSWYITTGHLYYYSSGSDLWDIELETGSTKKLIDLADTVKSVTALFTDSHVILLDDQPDSQWGVQSGFREGGEQITVYDYNGNVVGEVGLSYLYEKYSDAVQCSPVFADGKSVYVLLYRGMYMSASNNLFRIDWETGNIVEVSNWPEADNVYDDTVSEIWQVG